MSSEFFAILGHEAQPKSEFSAQFTPKCALQPEIAKSH